ncbi:uncharacterized protein F4822DRAFT_389787 [Hypoxylon trugodes]|uniref:uncharacterized protein n=1 Tax=Hypoxylon trugodes TaxID=326681 RepID=UPI00219A11AB|nr:uncharacterized protein F4822DRAFT_389787 [Hypoxylon trugodes]KAI1392157.1 hypothetical protein F4822DRAFT_389787 [Hypoxylon trugodes]
MKNSLSLVALAAGLSQVSATGFGFSNAPKFTCPDNTDNTCIPEIIPGINWSDLPLGGFDSYKGFKWSGFTCADKFSKRDELAARTSSFQSKCITGTASSDKGKSPKISCDKSKGVDKTSISKFQVTPAFDCDLEFHYTMPTGETCKHRSPCKASGTVVENTQCGGATDVTVVYPKQPNKPKDTCDFGIHHIEFDCSGPKPSKPAVSSSYVVSTPSASPSSSVVTFSYSASIPTISVSSSSPVSQSSYSASVPTLSLSYSASVPTLSSYSASSPSQSASSTASTSATESSSYVVSSSSATSSATQATSSSYATVGTSSSESVSSYSVTSYLSTSTVFTTSVQTITSCGSTVSNCPAGSTALTTVTVPVSTTICPVTETVSVSQPTSYPSSKPVDSTSAPIGSSTTAPVSSSSTSPAGPVETLPCPGVVPSCLNTWMFSVGCKDNTDSACYCPDASFTKNIFTCLYAYGESDEVISEAISYFQGICAPFVGSNPGIATGAETITTVLTATPTTVPAAVTTIEVATTVVVPCTNEAGETIPSSSSTVTINTSITVPGVIFSTVTSGPSSTGVAVVPGTYSASVPVAVPTIAPATSAPAGGAPYPTVGVSTTFSSAPVGSGTGVSYPTSTPNSSPIATAGAAHIGAGFGILGFAGMIVAAAL